MFDHVGIQRVVREVGTYPSLPSSMFDHVGIQRVVREVGGVDKRSSTSSASSLSTDGVEFITNPTADEVTRPAKRSKGSSEGDVEIMGSIGMVLPHNRFSCPEVRTGAVACLYVWWELFLEKVFFFFRVSGSSRA